MTSLADVDDWIASVVWTDLLLVSWPVETRQLEGMVPPGVKLDTFNGFAWISIVPFRAKDLRFNVSLPLPGPGDFCELNVRTYVRMGDLKAVLFLSLDTPSRLANFIGERFRLPFEYADVRITPQGDGYRVESHRHGGEVASFVATYRPAGPPLTVQPDTLEAFLTDRLSLIVQRGDRLYRADVDHSPWVLQPAHVAIHANTVAEAAGVALPTTEPHAMYAAVTASLVYPLVDASPREVDRASFHFKTTWRLNAPLEAVWDCMHDYEGWPFWWDGVEQVEVIERGGPDTVGMVLNHVWKSKLPYRLRFTITIANVERRSLIEVRSQGELNGSGTMEFSREGDHTVVRFDWKVETASTWMNVIAPLARPAFKWNHDTIMEWGARGLQAHLDARLASLESTLEGRLPWIMEVEERDVLFASWPVPRESIGRFVPAPLEIDTYKDHAWVTVESLRIQNTHLRRLPQWQRPTEYTEVNLRTYVKLGDAKGIVFISLDCPGLLSNVLGQVLFRLPFHQAQTATVHEGTRFIVLSHRVQPEPPAHFAAQYEIGNGASAPRAGTLADFLVNRFSLYVAGPWGLWRGDVEREPWTIQPVKGRLLLNSVPAAAGIDIANARPHFMYSRGANARVFPLVRVRQPAGSEAF